MQRLNLFILCCLLSMHLAAQQTPILRQRVCKGAGGEVESFELYDAKGNITFKNERREDTGYRLVSSIEHDDQGRIVRIVYGHSKVGFLEVEKRYEGTIVKTYSMASAFPGNTGEDEFGEPFTFLKDVMDKTQFDALPLSKFVQTQSNYLSHIEHLDDQERTLLEINLDENGDTLDKRIYTYHSSGEVQTEHYEDGAQHVSIDWTSTFDEKGRIVSTHQTEEILGEMNRSAFEYDAEDRLVREMHYRYGVNDFTREYTYDSLGRLIKDLKNEVDDELRYTVTYYSYNADGDLEREWTDSYNYGKLFRMKDLHIELQFWEK